MTLFTYDSHPLIQYLRNPMAGLKFSVNQWERLLRSARQGSLSSRVGWLAEQSDLIAQFPEKVQFHFLSAQRVSQSQAISVNWEIAQIQKALKAPNIPFVVLKGGAYIKGNFAAASGRVLSDVDIMVPKSQINDVEKALYAANWFPTKLNAYDQRYYREWMHELPPMQHLGRGTTLDLHHTILPPTALLKPDVDMLWTTACPIEGEKGVFVLSPVDMVLHSATHLFHDGELEHGLRDLVDMDALIRQFSAQPTFLQSLINRAEALDLGRPLHYALKYCKLFLHTPIPEAIFERAAGLGSSSILVRNIMDIAVVRSLGSILEAKPSATTKLCEFAMFVRSHYLRMPFHQLIPHLLRKQFVKGDEKR